MTKPLEILAKNLKEELEDRGWSGRELARKAGITHTQVSLYLNAKKKPTLETLHKISSALGLQSYAELLLERKPPPSVSGEGRFTILQDNFGGAFKRMADEMRDLSERFEAFEKSDVNPSRAAVGDQGLSTLKRQIISAITSLDDTEGAAVLGIVKATLDRFISDAHRSQKTKKPS